MSYTMASHAESLTLSRPLDSNVNSCFGFRKAGATGGQVKVDRLHAGTDYRARTPTPVKYEGNYQSCKNGIGVIANKCGITQRFIHMSKCDAGNFVTGSTNTTQPHLHYELLIDGTPIDAEYYFSQGKTTSNNAGNQKEARCKFPEKACGTDLCSGEVRKCLLDHAKSKGGSGGGAGARADSNAAAPGAKQGGGSTPGSTGSSSTYVGKGDADPVTGEINTGSPYYSNSEDGRTTREIILDNTENAMPVLPESNTEFTQSTNSSNEVTGCATDTWKAMVNQSVLQTRREMLINQTFIAKGDSVMAYSCMTDSLKKVGEHASPIFSGTKRWVNVEIDILGKTVKVNKELGETSLDGAITNAATSAYRNYAARNFKHSMLGGMFDIGTSVSTGEEDPSNEDSGAQDALPCGIMNQVWSLAKCTNITDDPGFPKFEDLISSDKDPRKFPQNMSCKNTGITQGMIDLAKGKSVKVSAVETHFDKLLPEEGKCADPIATGVTVHVRSGSDIISTEKTYPDGLCVSPGCSYQNSGSAEGKCVAKGP